MILMIWIKKALGISIPSSSGAIQEEIARETLKLNDAAHELKQEINEMQSRRKRSIQLNKMLDDTIRMFDQENRQ